MITMDDVARLAGVSHGTVSKVINDIPGVSSQKIEKVKRAIEQLNYQPNVYARSLKKSASSFYDLIVPDIEDGILRGLYKNLQWLTRMNGGKLRLHVSHASPLEEQAALEEIQSTGSRGIFMITCCPESDFHGMLHDLVSRTIFLIRKPAQQDLKYIGAPIYEAAGRLLKELILERNKKVVCFSDSLSFTFDFDLCKAYRDAYLHGDTASDTTMPLQIHSLKDSADAVRACTQMLLSGKYPDVFIASNGAIADGIHYALDHYFGSGNTVPVIAPQSSDWINDSSYKDQILIPCDKISCAAFSTLAEKGTAKDQPIIIQNSPAIELPTYVKSGTQLLRLTISNGINYPFLRSTLPLILREFERKTGIKTLLSTPSLSNREYYELIKNEKADAVSDVFSMDLPMIPGLWKHHILQDLDMFPCISAALNSIVPAEIVKSYSMYRNRIVGVPFIFTSQLLYYHRKFFEDSRCKRLYFESTGENLEVPGTWEQYNKVARFFTKEYTPQSPTTYGCTITAIEGLDLLVRLWAEMGYKNKFSADDMKKAEFFRAIQNFSESCNYAFVSESGRDGWNKLCTAFYNGNTAMMTMYTDIAFLSLGQSPEDKIKEVGTVLMPSNFSVRGGWSLGINQHSSRKEEAGLLLQFLMSDRFMTLSAINGRVFPNKHMIDTPEFLSRIPWYSDMIHSYKFARNRPDIRFKNYHDHLPGELFADMSEFIICGIQQKMNLEDIYDMLIDKFT